MLCRLSSSYTLTLSLRHRIGLAKAILHWVRTAMNRVRWEENQQFRALQQRSGSVPRTAQQASQLFKATQTAISQSEQARMQRIDNILGTRTYFHPTSLHQERLDSDHLMDIQQLKKENPRQSRKTLNWLNPQADVKVKYKHKKNCYKLISQLRTYPAHIFGAYDLNDHTNKHTISFLAIETAYATVSLKPTLISMASLEQEALFLPPETPLNTPTHAYFRPNYTTSLLRISKAQYTPQLLTDQPALSALGDAVEEVVSLQDIYNWLKDYDTDQRVQEFLRRVQNNRIQYLFSDFSVDREGRLAAITIDLMGDGREHCTLLKSLSGKQSLLPRPLFNLRPPVLFSPDSSTVYFIQRSPEGGWIELAARPVNSCWKSQTPAIEPVQDDHNVLYRCSPQNEMRLGTDSQKNFTFLTINENGRQFTQSLHMVSAGINGLKVLTVDEDRHCNYYYDMSEIGLIIGKKKAPGNTLKYGENQSIIESLQLIPFKQHIIQVGKVGLSDLRLPGQTMKQELSPQDLDLGARRTIFKPQKNQFIRQVHVRSSHIIMVLNYTSVYDRTVLYFLPLNPNAHPHSLILKGGPRLKISNKGYNYDNQLVQFSQPQGLLTCHKVYNIWKRQLSQEHNQASRYHRQSITVTSNGYPFELHLLCKSLYLSQKQLPVVLVLRGNGQTLDQAALRQLLEKGVMLIQFGGRGTQAKDLQHYLAGSRHNFSNMLNDLQAAIEYIGNQMTHNISLYCKGQTSSLVGLWFNFYFPYLFNASALHNGLYELTDLQAIAPLQDFFGYPEQQKQHNNININQKNSFNFQKFNVFRYKFRNPSSQHNQHRQQQLKFSLGHLQNIIISSGPKNRLHSRKLIKRLRQNQGFRYDQVYLKEYEQNYETDLNNFSYLYTHIRKRLERHQNEPHQDNDSEDN